MHISTTHRDAATPDSFTTAVDAFVVRSHCELACRRTSFDDWSSRMGSATTITAAAAAAAQAAPGHPNWPGAIMRETDVQVNSRELADLDAQLRCRSKYLPRDDGRWPPPRDHQALRDLASFLRDVTPPPGNYMSVRTPTSPSLSSRSSSRERKKAPRKVGTLRRCLGVLMRKANGKTKKLNTRHSNASLNSVSARPPSVRKKRWHSRIRLPDTAVAGTTVEGHRHIAISIPIEYAHLGPEPKYKHPKRDKRARPRSTTTEATPRIYTDVNVRPLSALVSEPHIGTQLGPVAEERESLSSKTPSWENPSYASSTSTPGGLHHPPDVRRVRLASRNTFGTVHEEFGSPNGSSSANNSRPATRSGSSPTRTPLTPPPRSSSAEYARPRTSASSGRSSSDDVVYKSAHRMSALNALTSAAPRPSSTSAYSLRSFASASPGGTTGRVFCPKRNSSLRPPSWPDTLTDGVGGKMGRGRVRVAQGQGLQHAHSRDSSRDQYTLQESIFSEESYLESSQTVESGSAAPGPFISRGATRDGSPPSRREADARKRWSLGGSAGPLEDGTMKTNKQSPLSGKVLKASRSAEQLGRPSREEPLLGKQVGAEADEDGSGPLSRPGTAGSTSGKAKHLALVASPELIAGQAVASYEKGKQRESVVDQPSSPESRRRSRSRERQEANIQIEVTKPVPSPKERREHRKTVLLSRKQRIAELRKALEKPGAQPEDLLWDRRLSTSSEDSVDATPTMGNSTRAQQARPTTLPASLSFTGVLTVADVRPSSPAGSEESSSSRSSLHTNVPLNRMDSVPLSLSSPATLAAIVKNSPVPPFQGLGSVTPPQSPRVFSSSPSTPSPSSELYAQHDEHRSSLADTPLRPRPHPPLKRLSSVRRRTSSQFLRDGMGRNASPPRPKTAGKGGIVGSRRKDYFSSVSFGHDQQLQQPGSQATFSSPATSSTTTSSSSGHRGGQSATGDGVVAATADGAGKVKSALKMTRSELFERYEAMRDRQTRDLERRLRRLEKHGDYWLTSMLPLLTDLSQSLGQLALSGSERRQNQPRQQQDDDLGKSRGKGRAAVPVEEHDSDDSGEEEDHDDEVRHTIYADGRKSRFGTRSTPVVHLAGFEHFQGPRPSTSSFEPSEDIFRRNARRGRSNTAGSGRVYLHDGSDASHHPGLGYRVRLEDLDDEERDADHQEVPFHEGTPAASSSRKATPHRYQQYDRTSPAHSTPARKPREQDGQPQAASGSTTMVDNTSIINNNNNAAQAAFLGKPPGSFRTLSRSSSWSLHEEYRQHGKRLPSYTLHPNAPLSMVPTGSLSEHIAAETERLSRLEQLNDHIDGQMRSLASGSSMSRVDSEESLGGLLPPPRFRRFEMSKQRSVESLETYRGSSSEEEEEDSDMENMGRGQGQRAWGQAHHNNMGGSFPSFSTASPGVARRGATGMERVTPLMRELQANGSRLSLESEGSFAEEGDPEVQALRRGPEPTRHVVLEAFR